MNKIYNINRTKNVIGQTEHRNFIELQAVFAIAQRGGSRIPGLSKKHTARIASNINLLTRTELKSLIFGESIYGN